MSRRDRDRSASATAPALVTQGPLAASAEPLPESAPEAPIPAIASEAPPVDEPPAAPSPRRYRVTGPGSVVVGGRFHGPGAVLDLTPVVVASLGSLVTPV